ncbi:DUF4363 family protein [Paradesulfitobacterium ferrireducens]|uniref:DUF4363 family protein n=1 Tax=Paradesulfitobacterium ferrireducens TaxID=2816476 RepID=UPI001A8D5375|nr:DUF4363 family protein [Paradesulfitobacterium ferrireducens]
MRTVAIILIISFLLGGFAITSYKYIKDSSHEMVTEIEKIEASLTTSNWNKAQQELGITQAKWEKTKYWWSILLHHQEIDNIDLSLERLSKYIETKGSTLSLAELAVLKKLFDHISDTEALTLRNIL